MIAYLAHAIDFRTGDGGPTVEAVRTALQGAGWMVYDPAEAWHGPHGQYPSSDEAIQVQEANDAVLDVAGLLVAVITAEPTIGTIREVMRAVGNTQRVIVFKADGRYSLTLDAMDASGDINVVSTITDLLKALPK